VAMAASTYGLSTSFAIAAPVPEKFDGSAFKLKAPEPNAKSGGVLRHGMPLRAPHCLCTDVAKMCHRQFFVFQVALSSQVCRWSLLRGCCGIAQRKKG